MDKTLVEYLEREGFKMAVSGPIAHHRDSIEGPGNSIEYAAKRLKDGKIKDFIIVPGRLISDGPFYCQTTSRDHSDFVARYVIYEKE